MPITLDTKNNEKPQSRGYKFALSSLNDPFGFTITRASDGAVIYNTMPAGDVQPLVFEDQYIRMTTTIQSTSRYDDGDDDDLTDDSPNIYGLGERVHSFRLDPSNKDYNIFANDHGTSSSSSPPRHRDDV